MELSHDVIQKGGEKNLPAMFSIMLLSQQIVNVDYLCRSKTEPCVKFRKLGENVPR